MSSDAQPLAGKRTRAGDKAVIAAGGIAAVVCFTVGILIGSLGGEMLALTPALASFAASRFPRALPAGASFAAGLPAR